MLPLFLSTAWKQQQRALQASGEDPRRNIDESAIRRFAEALTVRQRPRSALTRSGKRHSHARRAKTCANQPPLSLPQQGADTVLDTTIHELQSRIAELERSTLLRDSVLVMWQTNPSAVAMDRCSESFQQVAHGYDPRGNSEAWHFLASVFQPDVVCRDFQGLQVLVDRWARHTRLHDGLTVRLLSLTLVYEDERRVAVHTTAETSAVLTRDTLAHIYPAFHGDLVAGDPGASAISSRLVGRRCIYPWTAVLHFDQTGRVFAFESRVNFVAGLLELLRDPHVAVRVFQALCMTPDGH